MTKTLVTLFIAIDCDGDYAFGTDEDQARERYAEDVGDANERAVIVREVQLNVPLPIGAVPHVGAPLEVADEPEPEAVEAA